MSKPERVFKAGAVRAAIFRNEITKQGKTILLPKVVLEVRYRDQAGEWKSTNSLSLNDVPKAIMALQNAYAYLLERREGLGDSGESSQEEERVETVKIGASGPRP